MGIELSPRIHDHGFQKKRDSSCSAFLDAFYRVPPLYLPIYQPLAYYANRPRAIFQRPIVPRKRQEEHNKGEKKAHVLRVRVMLLLLLFVHAVCRVASKDVSSLVQSLFRFRIVTASFTAVGIPRWPEPTSPFSHFPPAPTSSGRGIFVVVLRQAGQID